MNTEGWSPALRREYSLALIDQIAELWGATYVFVTVSMPNTALVVEQSDAEITEYDNFLVFRPAGATFERNLSIHLLKPEVPAEEKVVAA